MVRVSGDDPGDPATVTVKGELPRAPVKEATRPAVTPGPGRAQERLKVSAVSVSFNCNGDDELLEELEELLLLGALELLDGDELELLEELDDELLELISKLLLLLELLG